MPLIVINVGGTNERIEQFMATIAEQLDAASAQVTELTAQVGKIRTENADLRTSLTEQNATLVAKVAELQALLDGSNAPTEKLQALADGLASLKTLVDSFDEDVPDPVVEPPAEPQA